MPGKTSTKSLSTRLTTYSAIAAATSVAGGTADAGEVVHDIPDITASGILFDFVTGSANSSDVNPRTGLMGSSKVFVEASYIYIDPAVTNGGFAYLTSDSYKIAIPQATAVSPTQDFGFSTWFPAPNHAKGVYLTTYSGAFGLFPEGETKYVGVKFQIEDDTHYGWAQITRDAGSTATLHGFGYNDTPGAASLLADTVDPVADLSGDGDVDDEDLGLFFSAFTGPDNGPSLDPRADLSGDGDVDDEDLGLAFSEFTGPLGPANVPEPASLIMLAMGAAGLASRRTRKTVS